MDDRYVRTRGRVTVSSAHRRIRRRRLHRLALGRDEHRRRLRDLRLQFLLLLGDLPRLPLNTARKGEAPCSVEHPLDLGTEALHDDADGNRPGQAGEEGYGLLVPLHETRLPRLAPRAVRVRSSALRPGRKLLT
jgi:hypothetical protein